MKKICAYEGCNVEFESKYGRIYHSDECYKKQLKIFRKKWNENNPEKVKEYNKKWMKNNPEKVKEKDKRWRDSNPEKLKRWKKNNPERTKEISKKWKKNNSEKVKESDRKYKLNKKLANQHFADMGFIMSLKEKEN